MIKTFLAMTTYGQIFYSEIFSEEKTDISLTAGLISAVYQMTTEIEEEKIESFDLENVRTVFREDVGEKLFVITVDKRMDKMDSSEMLGEIIDRFNHKYGDKQVDGLILSDFAPVLSEVITDRIWYSNPHKFGLIELFAYLALLFSSYWYPMMLLDGRNRISHPIDEALALGPGFVLNRVFLISMQLLLPITVTWVLVTRSNMRLMVRFIWEFIARPTRGSYTELLPWWFLGIPLLTISAAMSFMRWGRGIYYSLFSQTIGYAVERNNVYPDGSSFLFDAMMLFLAIDLLIWMLVFAVIVGGITGNLSWRFIQSMSITTSISLLLFIPSFIFSGIIYQTELGFHPESADLYPREVVSLNYIFMVTIPTFLFLLVFAYYVSIGSGTHIKRNSDLYKYALPVAIFAVLALQKLTFWFIFDSEIIFASSIFN